MKTRMLVRFDGIVTQENVLHKCRRVTYHLRTAESDRRSNDSDESIP